MSNRYAAIALAIAGLLTLSGCADAAPTASTASDGGADGVFPVTVEHAYGTTTVESQPERVATIVWANHDAALALGVVPVGMPRQDYGDDDGDGILPWVEDALEEDGADGTPVLFDESDGVDFEAIADTEPDLILAVHSGITEEEYDTLSQIAPTVAFPDTPFGATWRDTVLLNAKALGLEEQGEQLVADLEEQLADAREGHEDLEGLTAMFAYVDPADMSKIGYYTVHDARTPFLEDLGLEIPESVAELSADTDVFYAEVSAENADVFDDVDVIVDYGDADVLAAMQADPLLGTIPAVAAGSVVMVQDGTPLASAASPPTALSLAWSLPEWMDLLSAAAEKVER